MTAAEPVPLPEHIARALWRVLDSRWRDSLTRHVVADVGEAAFAAATADDIKALCPGVHAEIQASALDDMAEWLHAVYGDSNSVATRVRNRAAALRDQT